MLLLTTHPLLHFSVCFGTGTMEMEAGKVACPQAYDLLGFYL